MIDPTRAPVPLWKRYLTIGVLCVLVLAAALFIYKKELHHSSPSASKPAASLPASGSGATPPTTAPAPAVSSRDPFAG